MIRILAKRDGTAKTVTKQDTVLPKRSPERGAVMRNNQQKDIVNNHWKEELCRQSNYQRRQE